MAGVRLRPRRMEDEWSGFCVVARRRRERVSVGKGMLLLFRNARAVPISGAVNEINPTGLLVPRTERGGRINRRFAADHPRET